MFPLISIIVPVYNSEKYLVECIDSLINQTYENIEIILVNDGSTDSSGKICDEYALTDKRIRVIHKLNGGVTSARKAGILNAKGTYVGFVDSDDYISEKMYEVLYKYSNEMNADIVIQSSYNMLFNTVSNKFTTPLKRNLYSMKDANNDLYKNIFLCRTLCMCLFRKKVIESHLLKLNERIFYGEDTSCLVSCLINSDIVYICDEPLYTYRMNTSSVVHSAHSDFYLNLHLLYESLYDTIQTHQNHDLLLPQLQRYLFDLSLQAPMRMCSSEKFGCFYMFPYEKIKQSSNVVIYGAGEVGLSYCNQIKKNNYCNIALWVDKDFINLCQKGYDVKCPNEIQKIDFDVIIVAIKNPSIASHIADFIVSEYGINEDKIVCHAPLDIDEFIF